MITPEERPEEFRQKTAAERFKELRQKYKDYTNESYEFAYDVLESTLKKLKRNTKHLTPRELLEGYRIHSINEFGCLAKTVLDRMGLRETKDIGNIVFQLIEFDLMEKQERDKREEFNNVYDFDVVFNLRPIFSYDSDRKEWKAQYIQRNKN